ncbi:MAG: tyrosine-type recombinase/integrase [Verrucomicrobiae bacterium]|nr:tyrosine-type recombinase/integrase [Verrucomicrobiae bacterium]
MNISFEILIDRHARELEIRNFSPRTIEDMVYSMKHLTRFLRERKLERVKKISPAVLNDFHHWLFYQPTKRGAVRSAGNLNQVLAKVKGFFRFLKAEGELKTNPAEALEYAREPQRLPRNILTPQEAKRIIERVDGSTAQGYRDRVMLEVFYATGIRQSELINLSVGDVRLEEGLLFIREGKGRRDRVVPLGGMACKYLETYLKGVRPELLKGRATDRLFISYRGKPMDRNSVGKLVRKYAKLAKVSKPVSCHVWRHTCATHLLKNNANLRHVQEILGHRSLATTERYLHLTIADLKEAHRRFHPREKALQ